MAYVRYTGDVELLEVSEDYMKLSESSAISTFMRCECDVGRLYVYEGEFSWQHHYLYAVGDPLPFHEYAEPCKCKYGVDEKMKRVWFDYLYVPEKLCMFMKRFSRG